MTTITIMPVDAVVHDYLTCIKTSAPVKTTLQVVFSHGTVIDFNNITLTNSGSPLCSDQDAAPSYDVSSHELPEHRFESEEKKNIIRNVNTTTYGSTIARITAESPNLVGFVNTAYKELIDRGYPYPGGESADTSTSQMADKLWFTSFRLDCTEPAPSVIVGTMTQADSRRIADTIGRECRRRDYIMPHIAYILHGHDIVFENEKI